MHVDAGILSQQAIRAIHNRTSTHRGHPYTIYTGRLNRGDKVNCYFCWLITVEVPAIFLQFVVAKRLPLTKFKYFDILAKHSIMAVA